MAHNNLAKTTVIGLPEGITNGEIRMAFGVEPGMGSAPTVTAVDERKLLQARHPSSSTRRRSRRRLALKLLFFGFSRFCPTTSASSCRAHAEEESYRINAEATTRDSRISSSQIRRRRLGGRRRRCGRLERAGRRCWRPSGAGGRSARQGCGRVGRLEPVRAAGAARRGEDGAARGRAALGRAVKYVQGAVGAARRSPRAT